MIISTEAWVRRRISGADMRGYEPDLARAMPGLPLVDAVEAHLAWYGRLRETFREHRDDDLDANALGVDDMCILGKWIYGDGKGLAALPQYEDLRQAHAQFHAKVRQIIRDHKAGHMLESINGLSTVLPKLSEEVSLDLARLAAVY